jgi:hypothetical protein
MHMGQDVELTTRFSEPEGILSDIFAADNTRSLFSGVVVMRYRPEFSKGRRRYTEIGGDMSDTLIIREK